MSTIILNVVIILGIIIAGGFLIFFVGDLLMSIIDPNGDEKRIKSKRKKDVAKFKENLKNLSPEMAEEVKKEPKVAQILALAGDDVEQIEESEIAKAKDKKKKNEQENDEGGAFFEAYESNEPVEVEEEKEGIHEKVAPDIEEHEDEFVEDEHARKLKEAREALERRKEEILRRLKLDADDAEEEEDEDSEDDESASEKDEHAPESTEMNDSDDEENSQENETTERRVTEEIVVEDSKDDEEKIENLKRELEEEKQRYATLIKELQAKKLQQDREQKLVPNGLKEDYLRRLAEKKRALEENEKDLRMCNKEYKPLLKVKKDLEKEENKLRIKEAQVAKQKVDLYKVDNYADIDPEKAKKLSEELDLLEGLKLSVQHCREVIASNKDRMPVIERMIDILTKRNNELKRDIENLENEIDNLNE